MGITDTTIPKQEMKTNRTTKALFAFSVLVLLLSAVPISTSSAQTADDPAFVRAVNDARASAGLNALTSHGGLADWACQQSQRMAAARGLSHSDMNGAMLQVAGATTAGENVAYGASVTQIMGMWMGSQGHHANIHNSSFTHIGSCTVRGGDGWLYATNVFAGVPGGASAPPPPPKAPTCYGLPATIVARPGVTTIGTSGPDVIIGTPGPDRIEGRGGRDRICSKAGNDTVLGGTGKDWVSLGKGSDVAWGGTGSDRLKGNSGTDTLYGQKGKDDFCGGGSGTGDRADGTCERTAGIP